MYVVNFGVLFSCSVGKSVNYAIILATLIIDGKKHGMHPFLTPLRSTKDHKPLPGQKKAKPFIHYMQWGRECKVCYDNAVTIQI